VDDEKMPVTEHLDELRVRLIKCIVAVIAGFLISYSFAKQLFNFLTYPLIKAMPQGGKLIYTAPQEAFVTYMKISFFAGLCIAAPVIFYQIWKFIMPGLYEKERTYVVPFVIAACIFFILGASFAFFVAFPFAFSFFLSFTTDRIVAMPSMKEYLSLCLSLIIAFGITFELPVIMFFLARMGLVDHTKLKRSRKYAVLIISCAAAFLTPPDILSMFLLIVPLYFLYEISILVVYFTRKKKVPIEEVAG
jgi:sec-independent protein translocase protein TatC